MIRVNSTRPLHHAWGRLSKTKHMHACMISEQKITHSIACCFCCVLACFGQVPWFKLVGWTFKLPSALPPSMWCRLHAFHLPIVFLDNWFHGLLMQHCGLNACMTMHMYVSWSCYSVLAGQGLKAVLESNSWNIFWFLASGQDMEEASQTVEVVHAWLEHCVHACFFFVAARSGRLWWRESQEDCHFQATSWRSQGLIMFAIACMLDFAWVKTCCQEQSWSVARTVSHAAGAATAKENPLCIMHDFAYWQVSERTLRRLEEAGWWIYFFMKPKPCMRIHTRMSFTHDVLTIFCSCLVQDEDISQVLSSLAALAPSQDQTHA
jgi:hypothetical protein